MFKEKYKKANASIRMTENEKAELLKCVQNEKSRSTVKSKSSSGAAHKFSLAMPIAAILCLFILGGAVILPGILSRKNGKDELKPPVAAGNFTATGTVKTAKSYDDVYAAISSYAKTLESTDKYKGSSEINEVYDDVATPEVSPGSDASGEQDYSDTNTQIKGADEADIIKTNGKNIYALTNYSIKIYSANGKDSEQIASIDLNYEDGYYNWGASGMYLYEDTLAVLSCLYKESEAFDGWGGFTNYYYDYYYNYSMQTVIDFYDISNPEKPEKINTVTQDGDFRTSRLTNGILYTISTYSIYPEQNAIDEAKPETFVPSVCCSDGSEKLISADCITILDEANSSYCVITATDLKNNNEVKNSIAILGYITDMFASHDSMLLYKNKSSCEEFKIKLNEDGSYVRDDNSEDNLYANEARTTSQLYLISMNDGNIEFKTSCELNGLINNQFSIDEYNGYFRIVTTFNEYTSVYRLTEVTEDDISYSIASSEPDAAAGKSITTNNLFVLNDNLEVTGKIENIAEDELIQSARFMGDIGYFVTFRQVDPLFSVDLKDPENPKIIGALKIPGFSSYLQSYGEGLLLGFGCMADEQTGITMGTKLSMFDVSDPSDVKEIACLNLPGEYSPAINNHKAILADPDKNLICFSGSNFGHYIYTYADGEFKCKAILDISTSYDDEAAYCWDMRGMYIGDFYYLVDLLSTEVNVYDINTFEQVAHIDCSSDDRMD